MQESLSSTAKSSNDIRDVNAASTNEPSLVSALVLAEHPSRPGPNSLGKETDSRETLKPNASPWDLKRVVAGHAGWVRAVAVDPGNKWFATGGGDRLIKVWGLDSGELKSTHICHMSSVRGLGASFRQPYLFSCGEDKVLLYVLFPHSTLTHPLAM